MARRWRIGRRVLACAAIAALAASSAASCPAAALGIGSDAALTPQPSRKPAERCTWERFSDAQVGLAAWVQRCDYGFRKIDFLAKGRSLAIRYSDGGEPDALIDMFDLASGEAPVAAIRRIFVAGTDPAIARRCVLSRYRSGGKLPAGAARYTFVPDAAYRKELKAKSSPDEVGDPACGDWGDAPDGIQYFEAWPKSRAGKFAFVRIGQDEPLFDERTLRPLAGGPR